MISLSYIHGMIHLVVWIVYQRWQVLTSTLTSSAPWNDFDRSNIKFDKLNITFDKFHTSEWLQQVQNLDMYHRHHRPMNYDIFSLFLPVVCNNWTSGIGATRLITYCNRNTTQVLSPLYLSMYNIVIYNSNESIMK